MKVKILALVAMVIMSSIAFALNVGPSQEEKKYWDTTSAPTDVVTPVKDAGKYFNVSISSWDPNSLSGKITVSFPAYSFTEMQSCVARANSTHLSYFTDAKYTDSGDISCSLTNEGNEILDGKNAYKYKVTCSNIPVLEGVIDFSVTCQDKVGAKTSAETRFIIDKMAPYVDPNTIEMEEWGVNGEENANLKPSIEFDAKDLTGTTNCWIAFPTFLKENNSRIMYYYTCNPSNEEGDFGGIKTTHMVCTPDPYDEFQTWAVVPGEALVVCVDKVGNTNLISNEATRKINIVNFATETDKIEDVILKACDLARNNYDEETLNAYGFHSASGNGSPELDDGGIYTFVIFRGSEITTNKDWAKKIDDKIPADIPRPQCAATSVCMGGVDAIALSLAIPSGGASEAIVEEGKATIRQAIKNLFKNLARRLRTLANKITKGAVKPASEKLISKGSKTVLKQAKSSFIEGLEKASSKEIAPWVEKAVSKELKQFYAQLYIAKSIEEAAARTKGGAILFRILAGRFLIGGFQALAQFATANQDEGIYVERMTDFDPDNAHEIANFSPSWNWAEFVAGLIPFGSSAVSTAAAFTGDKPDLWIYGPSKIKPGVTYEITARIVQISGLGSTDNPMANALAACFDSCPDYVCQVMVIPDKQTYNKVGSNGVEYSAEDLKQIREETCESLQDTIGFTIPCDKLD